MATNLTWSISRFYNTAWDLTKKHKELWILGLLVAFLAGGSGGGNNWSNVFNDAQKVSEEKVRAQETDNSAFYVEDPYALTAPIEDSQADMANPIIYNDPVEPFVSPGELPLPFGESEEYYWLLNFMDKFRGGNPFARVPMWVYVLGGVSALAFILEVIVLALVAMGWAKASMIKGVAEAVARPDRPVDLAEVSRFGLSRARPMIWLQIVPVLMFMFVTMFLVMAGLWVTGNVNNAVSEASAVPMVLMIIWFAAGVYAVVSFVKLMIAIVWAERHVVLDELPGRAALKAGFVTAQGNNLKTLLVGFVNMIMGMIALFGTVMMFAILIILGIIPVLVNKDLIAFTVSYAVILAIMGIAVYMVYMAASQVFFHAVWQQAFDVVRSIVPARTTTTPTKKRSSR
jgi:hypothetical protein